MNHTIAGSMHLDVTDWMPGSAHPAREGVYERRVSNGSFSCWGKDGWREDADSPAEAAGRNTPSRDQHASWRGLVEPSDQPCATCRGHTIVDGGQHLETDEDLLAECVDC